MADQLRMGVMLGAVVAALLLAALSAGPALATHTGSEMPDETYLQVSYQRSTLAGVADQLVAELRADDGSAVAGVEVEFLRQVEFLGPRRILLGRATTDTWGTARVPLSVRATEMDVLALFRGNDVYKETQISTHVKLAAPPRAPVPIGPDGEGGVASLAVMSAVMPTLLVLSAAAVWLVLLGLAVGTLLAIRRGRSQFEESARKE